MASTIANETIAETVLRRPIRFWPVDALVVIVAYALVAATISLHEDPRIASRVNLYLGIAALAVGLALVIRRPAVTLRQTGLTVGGQTFAWADITGIYEVRGLRGRYVRIFVGSQQQYWRLPALTTSRVWPGAAYRRNLAELERFSQAYTDEGIRATADRRAPGWLYPAFAVVVLGVPVAVSDPVDYWLPRALFSTISTTCDLDLTGGLTADALTVDSPMLPGTQACQRRGPEHVVVEQVLLFKRSAVLNGSGVAHALYQTCSFPHPGAAFDPPPQPGPLPADEASASGYQAASNRGVYLIARRANAIVFVGYTGSTTGDVAAWSCDTHKNTIGNGNWYGTTMARATPAGMALVTGVARQILRGLS